MTTTKPADAEVLVSVNGVSRAFCKTLKRSLWYGIHDIASELMIRDRSLSALRSGEFWAVEKVSFEVCRGECLGLIGHNGAGKTTLLKLLCGLIKPSRGCVEIDGRVGALIELGTGNNPVLTGRENVFVSAAVHGLSKMQTRNRLDAIIDFAGLGEFIDMPVQSYSAGMKMRLGFAVAAHLDPDVLLIDEVLAVGDAGFRVKCYNKIDELKERCAIVFVSHSMAQVARLAEKSVVLKRGREIFHGPTSDAVTAYYDAVDSADDERLGTGEARIERLSCLGSGLTPVKSVDFGCPLSIRLEVHSSVEIESLVIDIGFRTMDGTLVAECNNYVHPSHLSVKKTSRSEVTIDIPALTLNPGRYRLSAFLLSKDMTKHFDWIADAGTILVQGGRPAMAGQQFDARWGIRPLR